MSTDAEAQEAIAKLNGESFEGRQLKVSVANPQRPRTGGGRPGGGGGGRRRIW